MPTRPDVPGRHQAVEGQEEGVGEIAAGGRARLFRSEAGQFGAGRCTGNAARWFVDGAGGGACAGAVALFSAVQGDQSVPRPDDEQAVHGQERIDRSTDRERVHKPARLWLPEAKHAIVAAGRQDRPAFAREVRTSLSGCGGGAPAPLPRKSTAADPSCPTNRQTINRRGARKTCEWFAHDAPLLPNPLDARPPGGEQNYPILDDAHERTPTGPRATGGAGSTVPQENPSRPPVGEI